MIVLHAASGGDHDPRLYIAALSPDGQLCGGIEWIWHWPDEADMGFKYAAEVHKLKFTATLAGVYTLGLYLEPEARTALAEIPFAIHVAT